MTREDSFAAPVLVESLGELDDVLREIARRLGDDPAVAESRHSLGIRKYESGSIIEGFADFELRSGRAIAFWVEARFEAQIGVISTKVLLNSPHGQEVVESILEDRATEDDKFVAALRQAAAGLQAAAARIRLAAY